jgi:hypothetical protein
VWLLVAEKLAEGVGTAPTSALPILFSRQVQPAYICLPSCEFTIYALRFTRQAFCRCLDVMVRANRKS